MPGASTAQAPMQKPRASMGAAPAGKPLLTCRRCGQVFLLKML
jgi:hypothetical protein